MVTYANRLIACLPERSTSQASAPYSYTHHIPTEKPTGALEDASWEDFSPYVFIMQLLPVLFTYLLSALQALTLSHTYFHKVNIIRSLSFGLCTPLHADQ